MLLFSPRMRADMSAALVETEENWNVRPGYSLRVMPPGETSSTVPEISSTGAVKCLSCMRMTDSRVLLTRLRIFSYSISSSVSPCACLPTICHGFGTCPCQHILIDVAQISAILQFA